jgi:hypothetical protein
LPNFLLLRVQPFGPGSPGWQTMEQGKEPPVKNEKKYIRINL